MTVTVQDAVMPLSAVTVITLEPAATPVTTPAVDTVALAVVAEAQVKETFAP